MKRLAKISFFIFLIAMNLPFHNTYAQEGNDEKRPMFRQRSNASPLDVARTRVGEAYVKITYSQPAKRERELFGQLVPFGQVWRTGANEATELTTTEIIFFGDKKLEAGTYSIFTIPNEDKWTIIVNKGLGQWGAFQYDESLDVYRLEVPTQTNPEPTENFFIRFIDDVVTNQKLLVMAWDTTMLQISIKN